MLSRILVRFFGNIWNLRKLCNDKNQKLVSLYKIIYNYYLFNHGSSIELDAKIKGVPTFPHGIKQIVITNGVEIGKNCIIFQQVTIATDFLPHSENFGSPIIGDNCYIYPGAKIIGNAVIGNNVVIGPNVIVNKNIPSNSYVRVADCTCSKMKNIFVNQYYFFTKNGWVHLDGYTKKSIEDDFILKKLKNE